MVRGRQLQVTCLFEINHEDGQRERGAERLSSRRRHFRRNRRGHQESVSTAFAQDTPR
jgi:hypothetical protein